MRLSPSVDIFEHMSEWRVKQQDRLAAFNRRLASGESPLPGEPHSALEAVEALAAAKDCETFSSEVWDIARRIHAAEVDDARGAIS